MKKREISKKEIILVIFVEIFSFLLFGWLGVYLTFFSTDTNKYDSVTTAYKIDVNAQSNSDGDTVYSPIYHFKVSEKEYECSSNGGSSPYPKQSKNIVYYDSKDPKNCMMEYEISNHKFAGIMCIIIACIILIFTIQFIKNPQNSYVEINIQQNDVDLETMKNIEYGAEQIDFVIHKFSIIIRRIMIGIVFLIVAIFIFFDILSINQTIKIKDYTVATATFTNESVELNEDLSDYVYTFEDTNGISHSIVVTHFSNITVDNQINIKYNPENPEEYYMEDSSFDKLDVIGLIVKIIIEILLVVLFFNKNLINKKKQFGSINFSDILTNVPNEK